jgi:hypothetical protein
VAARECTEEVIDEQRDVACSFAQRRKRYGKDIQSIVQVHAELPFSYHPLEILVCCSQYPHIDSSCL